MLLELLLELSVAAAAAAAVVVGAEPNVLFLGALEGGGRGLRDGTFSCCVCGWVGGWVGERGGGEPGANDLTR